MVFEMDLIICDLDGTLVDSRRDIATSVNVLLNRLGRKSLPNERIYGYIGNGVRRLLERALGDDSPKEVECALEEFMPIYREHLLDTTLPYPGVQETLESLRPGRILAVLTNKPQPEAAAVLEGLGLARYFHHVYGGESFPRRKPNPMGVHFLLEATGVPRERTLMVGDSRIDYETARNASISICMVSYGLGAAEIADLSPDHLIDDFRQLVSIMDSR